MPERQPSSGEATEQQVTGPVAPDGSARDDAAPHGAGPESAGAEGAGSGSAGAEGAGSRGPDSDGADRAPAAGGAASASSTPAAARGGGPASAPPTDPAHPSPAPRPTMPASKVAAGRDTARDVPVRETPAGDVPARTTPEQDAPAQKTSAQGTPAQKTPEQDAPAQDAPARKASEQDGSSPQRPDQETAHTGGPTAATAAPAPSAQAHDGATPSPTAPGADPGPQARGGLFTPPARGAGPTTPVGPDPAAGRSGNVPPAPAPAPARDAGGAAEQAPAAPSANGAQARPAVPPAATGPRPGPGAPGGDRPPAGTRPADAPPGNGPGNGPSAGGAELFGSWDDESTRVLPRVPAASEASTQRMRAAGPAAGAGATAAMAATGPMARGSVGAGPGAGGPGNGGAVPAASGPSGPSGPPGPPGGGDGPTGEDPDAGGGSGRRPRRTGLLVAAGVIAIVVLAYLGDLLFSSGSVPRGVTVAGQQIGGLSRAAAIERLQATIEPRSGQPVQVTAGPVRSEIDPKTAGLSVDYQGTLDQAGAQPLNPITRISSFFTNRDVGVVNKADERSVRTALEQLVPVVDRDPKDGTVRFDGLNPVPVEPVPGQRLDVDRAVGTLEQRWASGAPVALPLIIEPAATTPGDVQQAIDDVAKPAVSGPLTVTGEGANATVEPEDIAQALTFKADPDGAQKLVPQLNIESITDVVTPQLEKTEKPGVDAALDFASNPPKVVPSQDGRGIDYKASFANLLPVLTGPGPRTVAAVYTVKPPDITTAEIQSLGNAGEISTFTTGGFSADSGQNIKRAAEAIDGQIVAPGETFSLNRVTNPRDASRGYVEAGIIEDGHPDRGVGGGVSQLATTLYNASYFAGMVDVEHKEHSYYISRYPAAREATVFDNLIDVKFRNDGPTAVMIQTAWTPSNVTVTFFGTKRYDVTSSPGPRTNYTDPQVVNIPAGQPCSPSKGSPGFTATDTRTMRDVQTGETTSKTRTVKYNPQPIVKCG